jgi:hypothetical protein
LSSALLNVGQQLGGSVGLAVLGTIAVNVTNSNLVNVFPSHGTVAMAITAGYGAAFTIAAATAVVSVVIAVASITGRRRGDTMDPVRQAA